MTAGLQANVHYTFPQRRHGDNSNAGGRTMNPFDIQRPIMGRRTGRSRTGSSPAISTRCRSSGPRSSRPAARARRLADGRCDHCSERTPINVTIGGPRQYRQSGQRPDLVGTPSSNCGADALVNCIDPAAYAQPAQFTFGSAPRNHLRGPGRVITDLSLAKSFAVGGPVVQVRIEMFNLFNTANFDNPNAVFGTANFGRITSARPMRQMQLGARLTF